MKIPAGYEAPSGGELRIDGRPVRFAGPRAAEAAGIVLIHQEFNLAEDLTIAQNIFLGHEKKRGWLLDDAAMRAGAADVLRAGRAWTVDPDTQVRRLIVAEKQLVEIAKALARKARLLIMDEPTATLTPGETERLFALMRAAEGRRRDDRLHLAQARRGRAHHRRGDRDARRPLRRARGRPPTLTRQQMAQPDGRPRAGRPVPAETAAADAAAAAAAAGAAASTVPGWAEDVSFEVRAGRDPRLRRAGRRRPHRAVRRPARPAAAQRAARRARRPARCASAARARPPTTASPT